MVKAVPIRPITLSQQIKEVLLQKISDGDLRPGERIVESRIASEMQTSQAPVRDAIRELDALGIIEMRRNKGAIVREFDREELANIYAVRAELEGYAAAEIAQKTDGTAQDVGADLLTLCDQMEAVEVDGGLREFVGLNDDFHRTIIEATGNGPLLETWQRLDIQSRTALNLAQSPNDFGEIHRAHRAVANAIAQGQGSQARQALIAHIKSVVN